MDSTTTDHRAVSRLPLLAFVLALLLTASSTLVAVWWDAIDVRLVTAADDTGWQPGMLLPHQHLLWLAINGAVPLSAVLTVITSIVLRRSRRLPV